jgi:hypothetical protein
VSFIRQRLILRIARAFAKSAFLLPLTAFYLISHHGGYVAHIYITQSRKAACFRLFLSNALNPFANLSLRYRRSCCSRHRQWVSSARLLPATTPALSPTSRATHRVAPTQRLEQRLRRWGCWPLDSIWMESTI